MNSSDPNARPISFYILVCLIFFQTISGLFGGVALVIDPSGSFLQMPPSLLDGSPFNNYLIPGLILFTVLGIMPCIVLYGLIQRTNWAWEGTVLVGIALIIWIGVEILMVGYHSDPPLQLTYGLVGVVLLILTQIDSVKTHLKSKN